MQQQLQDHVSGQSNKPMSAPAHALSVDDVVKELQADVEVGLSPEEAKRRLEEHGRNEFGEQEGVQPLKIFIGQIANALTMVSPFFFFLSILLSRSIALFPRLMPFWCGGGGEPGSRLPANPFLHRHVRQPTAQSRA